MRIGIVTTWFERGAAYVSKLYKQLLEDSGHTVYVFARGGEEHESKHASEWNEQYVTRSKKYTNTKIEKHKLYRWIRKNGIEALFFNEQQDFLVLTWVRKDFPNIKLGAYVDYYTENTLRYFNLYDFLICNTKRHMQAMAFHPQKFYIEWGTDIDLYKPSSDIHNELTFFHSAGMSARKGTDILVDSYIEHGLFEKSKLVIHTQVPIQRLCKYDATELSRYNIQVIEKTVSAPGLYHMGDVYVYPTRLDGLGLTMYESLACGLPLITTDFPPMNEVGIEDFVKLVSVNDYYCRGDAYYFPMCVCDKDSLAEQMLWFIDNKASLKEMQQEARQYAIDHYNIKNKSELVSYAFESSEKILTDEKLCRELRIQSFRHTSVMEWIESFWAYHRFRSMIRGVLSR